MTRAGLVASCGLLLLRWVLSDLHHPAASALWAAAAAALAVTTARGWPRFSRAPALWLALGAAAWALTSTLWSVDPGASLAAGTQAAAAALFGLTVAAAGAERPRELMWSMVAGACLAAGVALRQILIGFPAARTAIADGLADADTMTRNTVALGRAFGTFFAPDMLGAALGAAILVGIGLLAVETGPRRIAAVLGVGLLIAGLAATRSVGAVAALTVGAVALGLAAAFRRHDARAVRPAVTVTVTVLCLIAIGVSVAPRVTGVHLRAAERLINQGTALRAFSDAPLRGHGYDSFGVVAPALNEGEALTRYAHGAIGQGLSDGGLIGGLLVLAMVIALLWQAGGVLARAHTELWRRAIAAAVLATLLHGLLDYDLIFAQNLAVLLSCAALLTPLPVSVPAAPSRGRWFVGVGAAAVLGLGLWHGLTAAAWDLAGQASPCEVRAARLAALDRWMPPRAARARTLALSWLACDRAPDRVAHAARWMERAHALSPRDAELQAQLGYVLALDGQRERAQAMTAAAAAAWPRVGRVHAYQGLVALLAGREADARACFARARRLGRHDGALQRLIPPGL